MYTEDSVVFVDIYIQFPVTNKLPNNIETRLFCTEFILTAKPRIQPASTSLKALIGQTVMLPCVVQGEPRPQISWLHNGLLVGSDRMLKIQAVQHSDSGTYSCVARNSAGEDTIEIVLNILGMSVKQNCKNYIV